MKVEKKGSKSTMSFAHSPRKSTSSDDEKDASENSSSLQFNEEIVPCTEQWYIDFVNPLLNRLETSADCNFVRLGPVTVG